MDNTEVLIKATLSAIKSKFKKSVTEKASEAAYLAKEVPENLKKEWESFKSEVKEEIKNIENSNDNNYSKDEETIMNIRNIRNTINEITKLLDKKY